MHEQLGRQVDATARALSKKTHGAAFAGAIVKLPGGKKGLAWAADETTMDDLEMMVIALLNSIADQAGETALNCDGCAIRMARARAAISAVMGDAAQPVPKHAH